MVSKRVAREGAAELARVKAAQAAKERRRRTVVIVSVAVVIVALVGVAGTIIVNESRRLGDLRDAASRPIPGVEESTALPSGHVAALPEPSPSTPGGTLLPPVGGDHDPVVQNCGVYTEPVGTANAVHSLEHGAVWITYRPGLEQGQVDELAALAQGRPYLLVSPFPDVKSPVVLSAWGVQLELEDAGDPRAEEFVVKYLQGLQIPEPGAACSGGVGTPA